MESKFQFSKPVLLNVTFEINDSFQIQSKKETKLKMQIDRKEERDEKEPEAIVTLCVSVGEKSDKAPFYVYAEEAARFRWDDSEYNEESVNRLLSQNAPALLLAYLRPIIANITGASLFNAYHIPFINFALNEN